MNKEHSHNHEPGHSHGHGHSHGANAPHKILMMAIIIIFGFAIVEAGVGYWSNSLALMGDAGHMASDSLALAIAAFAAWISTKPPSKKHSYGYGRAEVLAAWLSSLLMLIVSIAVIVEAVARIHAPEAVKGIPVMIVAFLGLVVNLLVAWVLARGERTLNIRAALLHVMGDVLGSIAALIAGAVIYYTGWFPIDPILSIFIGILITLSALRLLRESLHVLMEGVPGHIELSAVSQKIMTVDGVNALHDLHIWTLSSGKIALSAHVKIAQLQQWETTLADISSVLAQQFQIKHVTLQPEVHDVDCKPCTNNDPLSGTGIVT